MHDKNEKENKRLKKVLVITIIAIVLCVAIFVVLDKKNIKEHEEEQPKEYSSTLDMKEHAPLINMDNKENAKIENGEKINSSKTLQKNKTVSGLKLTKIQIHTEKGLSYFNATVKNTTKEDFERKAIYLKFKKSDGSVLAKVGAVIPTIKAGGKGTINASTTQDIANANDFEIELAK